MRPITIRFLAGSALAALLAAPAAADFIEASPPVSFTEPGLDETVPPLLTPAELLAQQTAEAAAIADQLNAWWNNPTCFAATGVTSPYSASGTTVTKNGPPNLGALTSACFGPGVAFIDYVRTTTRRTVTTVVGTLIDNTGGVPPGFTLTARASGVTPLTASAGTLDGAAGALLSAVRAATGRRYGAGAATLTGGGPLVVTDIVLSERVTQRDITYVFETYVGPGPAVLTGDILGCDTPAGCYGGIQVPDIAGTSTIVTAFDTTLHITRTVQRTLSAGVSFYDLALIALPSGTIHTAAAVTGFDTSDRLLRRLTNPSETPETGRWITWAEATGTRTDYRETGISADGWGMALGFTYAPSPSWTLGLAMEFGDDTLAVADPITPESGDSTRWQLGLHALYRTDRLRLGLAATYGEADTDTSLATYTPTFTGAAFEAGYTLFEGPFSLTVEAGLTLVSLDLPTIRETGTAPLTIPGVTFDQQRIWAGLSAAWASDTLTGKLHIRAVETMGDTITLAAFDPVTPGDIWTIAGPDTGGTAIALGGDIAMSLGASTTLALAYEGTFANDSDAHEGRLTLSIKW